MTFTEAELAYLDQQRLGRLATQHPDGTLQVSPVGFGVNTKLGAIDIGGHNLAASRKYRNVAANGAAAFVVDDIASVQPWVVRCLEIRGRAEVIENPVDSRANAAGPIIRLHPTRIISFGVDPDNPAAGKRNVG
jgi:pyridoxamine 5'-phosphate oxidase family protein